LLILQSGGELKAQEHFVSGLARIDARLARAASELRTAEFQLTEAIVAYDVANADSTRSIDTLASYRARCLRTRTEWRLARRDRDRFSLAFARMKNASQFEAAPTKPNATPGVSRGPDNVPTVRPRLDRDYEQRSGQLGDSSLDFTRDRAEGVTPSEHDLSEFLAARRGRPHAAMDLHHRQLLERQATALLSMVLAYLAYFYLDVQLQILTLPSVF